MKIVNKQFHDYYDSCMGYGVDEDLIYVRNQTDFELNSSDLFKNLLTQNIKNDVHEFYNEEQRFRHFYFPSREIEIKNTKYTMTVGYIGFCGKIYPYIRIVKSFGINNDETFIYTKDKMDKYIEDNHIDLTPKKYDYYWSTKYFDVKRIYSILESFEDQDIFFEIGNPCFVIERGYVTINPILKDYQFYNVFDPFTTFQEISMFLGGVLGKAHPPLEQISDASMQIKKGFGHKYAFRKEPQHK